MDFGCQRYGGQPCSDKVILILEEEPYRLKAAMSDLVGSDIEAHHGKYRIAVRKVRNWLTTNVSNIPEISASTVHAEYADFQEWHSKRQRKKGFSDQDIQDYPTSELLDEMIVWVDSEKPLG